MRRAARLLALLAACLAPPRVSAAGEDAEGALPATDDARAAPAAEALRAATDDPDSPWCAAGLEELPSHACVHLQPAEGSVAPQGTLVIFLHGVVKPASGWQHAQQLAALRQARQNGVSLLFPRGRRGHGHRETTRDFWTWPTSAAAQRALEAELFAEWRADRQSLEERRGVPFARVLVMGFSNGAYYATSLALRGAFPEADGFAVFAGGAGGEWMERALRGAARRTPLYLGWGSRDRAAADPAGLARLLESARWPHRSRRRDGVGHAFTDAMVREAVEYLTKAPKGQGARRPGDLGARDATASTETRRSAGKTGASRAAPGTRGGKAAPPEAPARRRASRGR